MFHPGIHIPAKSQWLFIRKKLTMHFRPMAVAGTIPGKFNTLKHIRGAGLKCTITMAGGKSLN
jgi:hypothetical protein